MAKFKFDLRAAIPAAWDCCWKSNLETRTSGDFRGQSYYLTATDLERRVRSFAAETCRGVPWGSSEYTLEFYGRIGGNLKGAVRDWLLAEARAGRLSAHNFDRGHISGMRFRPFGQPLNEAEEKTMLEKAKPPRPRLLHMARGQGNGLLCMPPRRGFYYRSRNYPTRNALHVTCPRCLKLLKERKEAA